MNKQHPFSMKTYFCLFLHLITLLFCLRLHAQSAQDLPKIVKNDDGRYSFTVDGKPFLVLGAQLWNSSAWPEITDKFWSQAEALGCNTIEAPIYWQNIEPEPGKFNFKELDHLISYGFPSYKDRNRQTGRVLVGQLGEDEFLLMGFDTKFTFRPSFASGYHDAEYILAEQGHYEGDQWVRERIWNGDALYHSTLPSEGAILKIKLKRVKARSTATEKANFDKDNQN